MYTKEIHVAPKNFHLGLRLAKVRSVRMVNGETHIYNMLGSLFIVTNYICCEKEFLLSSCCWLGALSAYGKIEQLYGKET